MTLQQFINGLHSALAAHPHAKVEQLTISDNDRYTTLRVREDVDGMSRYYCPLTFLCHASLLGEFGIGNYGDAANALALSTYDTDAVKDAADGIETSPVFSLLRRQLTRALCIPDEPEPKARPRV